MTELEAMLREHNDYAPVIPFQPGTDRLIALDLTAANTELTGEILSDTARFSKYIHDKLVADNARYGIGGYAEHRAVYSRSKVFDGQNEKDEPRRLHIGTDIWGKPYTPVMCPLDGIVHSFAFNNRFGDYGATILVSHRLATSHFYTLYGHLSLSSIKNIQGGERIAKGDVFAELGIPVENGQWPPHLHFQLIGDLQGWKGDYPGVCKYSEKEKWLANCPDPDIILQLNQYLP